MNLAAMLAARAEAGHPIRVGLIGAGKFGSTFLAQARLTPGIHVAGIADLQIGRARAAALGTPPNASHLFVPTLALIDNLAGRRYR